jgi:hypothetical protein
MANIIEQIEKTFYAEKDFILRTDNSGNIFLEPSGKLVSIDGCAVINGNIKVLGNPDALNNHNIEIYNNNILFYGTPCEDTTRHHTNNLTFYTSRNSPFTGQRMPVKYNDTLALFEAWGQNQVNGEGLGSRAGYFIFQSSDDFEPGKSGGEFFLCTTNIGTTIEQMRMIVDSERIYLQSDSILLGNNEEKINVSLDSTGHLYVKHCIEASKGYFGNIMIEDSTIISDDIEFRVLGKMLYNGEEIATHADVIRYINELVLNKK